ncbi:PA2817 family protein [Kistimonas scapharcae]|uniref:PA2817 family protein n=1 Tax=Kistimonas scapharcae TaxID=1036133 RepID=A0ABP8UWN8_9GAMM
MPENHRLYIEHHQQLLDNLMMQLPNALDSVCTEEQKEQQLEQLQHVKQALVDHLEESRYLGQQWLFAFIGNHPQLAPMVPRDLLWFFGGECLHFMSDDEISKYQRLEDILAEAEHNGRDMSWIEARRFVFN